MGRAAASGEVAAGVDDDVDNVASALSHNGRDAPIMWDVMLGGELWRRILRVYLRGDVRSLNAFAATDFNVPYNLTLDLQPWRFEYRDEEFERALLTLFRLRR